MTTQPAATLAIRATKSRSNDVPNRVAESNRMLAVAFGHLIARRSELTSVPIRTQVGPGGRLPLIEVLQRCRTPTRAHDPVQIFGVATRESGGKGGRVAG
ncbi:hypothetical protein [Humibacillus sp. DSM 29435]|uniref:hypothetical protein n=1 Tax=Humibacillus sp. DSM 29435 TaxID=1869167 RepID=UPI0011131823|nr:hypothetical protein [Humibacillus sp. DSM 29435]